MVRFLLTIFFVGLVVAGGSWAAVMALGGPDDSWVSVGDDHGDWHWRHEDRAETFADGQTTTRDLAWTAGDSLEISVPAVITYTQGPVAKITATGPAAMVNNLGVREDKIEFLHHRHYLRNSQGLTLVITAPGVQKFEINGAAKMTINAYAQDKLSLRLNGASKVDVIGAAKEVSLETNGASQSDLSRLVNETADVEMNGAGEATLATTGHADIEINGVGNAKFINSPRLSKHIHGFGSIETGDAGNDEGKAAPAAPLPAPAAPAAKRPRAKAEAA